jgi:DNA processing protein
VTASLVALAGLPGMGPNRLAALLDRWEPDEAWARVCRGEVGDLGDELRARWRAAAGRVDAGALWALHREAGVHVVTSSDPSFPRPLVDDPDPPAVLFVRGSLDALSARRVAIVGTRRCTWAGRLVARALGQELAAAGVCVLSGLALGIDGEAHRGALTGTGTVPPVAVVGTGLDIVYPRRHQQLWADVAATGAVVSEYPLGTPAERWRFPARNRIIAALAEVVVVVESGARGGSMHTVDAALERDRAVLAVPGPVRSAASVGTNGLLAAGCPPCRDASDVLVALGLTPTEVAAVPPAGPDDPDQVRVLDTLGWEPATLDELAERLGAPLGPVAVHLTRLANGGWVVQRAGWWERAR